MVNELPTWPPSTGGTTDFVYKGLSFMTLERDNVRAKVIATTLALMDEGGLEQIKARSIAKKVGISVGSIYNLFGSVDELIQETNAHILADMGKLGQINGAKSETELQQKISSGEIEDSNKARLLFRFLKLAEIYMDFVEANANRWAAMLAFNRNRAEGAAAEWYLDQQNALFDLVGNVLDETRLGDDEKTRDIAARALWSSVHGIVTMGYVGNPSTMSRDYTWAQIELLVTVFVDGLYSKGNGR